MMRSTLFVCGLSTLGLALNASGQTEDGWMRHFRIGAAVGMNIKADFQTSGVFAPSGSRPRGAEQGVNHTYDDGYVRVDSSDNKLGYTTNWGYDHESQVGENAEGRQTLSFHGTESFTANGDGESDGDATAGFDMAYGATYAMWEHVAIGWEFGFIMNPLEARDRSRLVGEVTRVQHTYTMDEGFILPPAGYRGVAAGVGEAIPDLPVAADLEPTRATVTGERSVEGILYNLKIGPLVRWEFYPAWTFNASAGFALGIFDGEYHYNEVIAPEGDSDRIRNSGEFGGPELSYGAYVGGTIMWDTGGNWEIYLGASYITMSDIEYSRPGRKATLDLGAGVYITGGINWSF